MTWGDRRSAGEQIWSGAKIAGAIILSLATIGLFGRGYLQVIHPAVRHEFIAGWAILLATSPCLLWLCDFGAFGSRRSLLTWVFVLSDCSSLSPSAHPLYQWHGPSSSPRSCSWWLT